MRRIQTNGPISALNLRNAVISRNQDQKMRGTSRLQRIMPSIMRPILDEEYEVLIDQETQQGPKQFEFVTESFGRLNAVIRRNEEEEMRGTQRTNQAGPSQIEPILVAESGVSRAEHAAGPEGV